MKSISQLTERIVNPQYVNVAEQNSKRDEKRIGVLLETQTLPQNIGWNEELIHFFLNKMSLFDTNNFSDNIGVGEREGRIRSNIVRRRHFGLAHGIGRSGVINANQPKAIGSSIILQLTSGMVLQTIRIGGCKNAKKCTVVPLCTGMTLSLVMRTIAFKRKNAKYIVWPRIDQRTCLKSIISSGFEPVIIPQKLKGDGNVSDHEALDQKIEELGVENILCVMSTSSCFAPRMPDNVIEISKICKKHDVPHLINNAFGIQSMKILTNINTAMKVGRVDAFVSSSDKNYEVPVGGGIIVSSNKKFIDECNSMYAGRGSMSPILDLFITLVSQSQKEYERRIKERKELFYSYFFPKVQEIATKYGERVLDTSKQNPISLSITLDSFKHPKDIGGKLFYRHVTGTRVYSRVKKDEKTILGVHFDDYGSSYDNFPHSYLVMSCSIGITKEIIDEYLVRLEKVLKQTEKI